MNSLAKRFIEVLEEDIKHWEEAASACDKLLPVLVGEDQRQRWRATAEDYRSRAKSHRALVELVKAEHGP